MPPRLRSEQVIKIQAQYKKDASQALINSAINISACRGIFCKLFIFATVVSISVNGRIVLVKVACGKFFRHGINKTEVDHIIRSDRNNLRNFLAIATW